MSFKIDRFLPWFSALVSSLFWIPSLFYVYSLCLSIPRMCWILGCCRQSHQLEYEWLGSSGLAYVADSSLCNWDKTRAARPREILRSINKLQTQLKSGGLAGLEVSRSCKSISSGFVLIPRKASISMSSPVVVWMVRWAVLVICQRHAFLCSGMSCYEFATLCWWFPVTKLSVRDLVPFCLLVCQFFEGISCSIHLVWSLRADPVNRTCWVDAPVPGEILHAFIFGPHPAEHIDECIAVSDGVDIGKGLKVARNVHCDSDYWHARCFQLGNGCLEGPLQLQAVLSPSLALALPAQHADPNCEQGSNRDHDHQELSDYELSDFWIHGFIRCG